MNKSLDDTNNFANLSTIGRVCDDQEFDDGDDLDIEKLCSDPSSLIMHSSNKLVSNFNRDESFVPNLGAGNDNELDVLEVEREQYFQIPTSDIELDSLNTVSNPEWYDVFSTDNNSSSNHNNTNSSGNDGAIIKTSKSIQ